MGSFLHKIVHKILKEKFRKGFRKSSLSQKYIVIDNNNNKVAIPKSLPKRPTRHFIIFDDG